MKTFIPPRLRAPLILLVGALIALVSGGIASGWSSVPYVAPILLVVVVAPFLLAGRDSDVGAAMRHQADERQEMQQLRVAALVGRVLAVSVAVAYAVSLAAGATLWPWGALLGVFAVAFVAGEIRYGEHGNPADGN